MAVCAEVEPGSSISTEFWKGKEQDRKKAIAQGRGKCSEINHFLILNVWRQAESWREFSVCIRLFNVRVHFERLAPHSQLSIPSFHKQM